MILSNTFFCLTFSDVDLLVCKHQGPSCCTRKMEENYLVAAKRETLSDILSYIYEPEHILSGHLDAFHGKFLNFGLEQVLDGIGWHTVERHAVMMCCHLAIRDIQCNNWWQDTDTPQSYPQDSIYYKKLIISIVIVKIAVKW